ncbi:hypothetical protein GPECTOR_55g260 [Gonium pectorale]|uniref:WW domain-containing protein n=1 Tax=Gonium pectorale TaxID=33097 RepID=A0A150G6A7_GONPE|nr:hypothetical protein GPECTOR_55g260 [Gonium pectorale]|eukprot:KXZ45354.1 hypothetical protein GPECTOR_55g260 [Gonium pectorale]
MADETAQLGVEPAQAEQHVSYSDHHVEHVEQHQDHPAYQNGESEAAPGTEPPKDPAQADTTPEAIAALEAGKNRALELASLFAAQAGHAPDSNKRKLEEGADGPDFKRAAGEGGVSSRFSAVDILPTSALLLGDGSSVTEVVMCPPDKVGRVIGRAGATIRDLEAGTGTRIQVDHKAAGEKPVTISGKREDVERAVKTVQDLIAGTTGTDASQPVAGEVQKTLECPAGIVGRVIGRGGETIRSLQQASGAHILVNQDFPEGQPREIVITGTQDSVDRAHNMVTELIGGANVSTQTVIQRFGVGSTEVLECPKAMVGRIIGKGGETIKDLQKRFSASIQIDQSSTPCKVTITGPGHMISSARRAVEELIRSTHGGLGGPSSGPPFNSPYGQQPYGGGPGGPYGGYGGYGMPAPAYGAPGGYPYGYSPYPAAVPPYGGYGGYGAPGAQPDMSAYQGYGQAASANQQQPQQSSAKPASVWQALQDDQARTYYYNTQTGVSQWEKPADMP